MVISVFVYEFLAIFLLNLIPILGPPTWSVLAFISFNNTIPSLPMFIGVALCASTLGRTVLTLSSKYILRTHLLDKKHRKNMDYLKSHIEKRPHFASLVFFIEAFTPLPSDQLFIAYGLTGMKLRYALVPFVLARIFTYSFAVFTATEFSKSILAKSLAHLSFLSWSFILAEILLLFLVYSFVRMDWEHFIMNRKFRLIR
jgi:hypothetical protein